MTATTSSIPFSWPAPGSRPRSPAPEDSADPLLVQETKNQIRTLVQEITTLSRSDISLADFHEGFLTRVVSALAAMGGAIWAPGEDGGLKLAWQIGLAKSGLTASEEIRRQHAQLLRGVIASGEPNLAPPLSGGVAEGEAGNASEYLLVLSPFAVEQEPVGVVEVFQRPGAGPTTHRGYLRFLVQMTDLAGEFLKNRRLRALHEQQALWRELEAFIRAVHRGLDARESCFTLANEGRRLIACDRLSVVLKRGGSYRVECVSGLDSLDRRALEVQRLARLAETVAAAGEPLWPALDDDGLPPQIEKTLSEYADTSHARMVAVLPLRASAPEGPPSPVFGAIVVERFHDARANDAFRQRAELAAVHGADALANALAHDRLFLMPLWRLLGRATAAGTGRNWPKAIAGLTILAAIVATLAVVPADFELSSPGMLRPSRRHEIYAPADGVLVETPVEHEQPVRQGDLLARIRNTDLEVSIASALGAKATLQEQIGSIERVLLRGRSLAPEEQDRLSAELVERREELATAVRRLDLLRAQEEQLTVRSPADGQVVTWQVHDLLASRPVARGQNLMTVIDPAGEWELELHVPEKRMGHVNAAWQEAESGLPVTFVLATHPNRRFAGRVVEIHRTADALPDEGAVVLVRAAIDRRQLPDLRDGAGVTAKIHCGRRSLGYTLFHDLFEAVQERWLLWF